MATPNGFPNHTQLQYHGRRTCPTVATGIIKRHKMEQEAVVKGLFARE